MSERRAKQIRRLEARVEVLERKLSLGPGFSFSGPQKKSGLLEFLRGLCRRGR